MGANKKNSVYLFASFTLIFFWFQVPSLPQLGSVARARNINSSSVTIDVSPILLYLAVFEAGGQAR